MELAARGAKVVSPKSLGAKARTPKMGETWRRLNGPVGAESWDLIGVILMDPTKKNSPPKRKHQILVAVFGPNHDTQKSTKTHDAISIAHSG